VSVGSSHRTLREVVSDEIRQMIIAGDLAPGERLYEDRLADLLGVSRNPVREALRALEGTGLVEVVPRRGAYVSRFEPDRARQLLELRQVLESYAAELAAKNRTDDDLAAMRACIERGRKATARNDVVEAAGCHREFHMLIERASKNEYLEPTVAPLRHQTELVFSLLVEYRGVTGWDEHERMLDAIERQDVGDARHATMHHMSSVLHDLALSAGDGAGD
jgi:DNA-binding GntR family transcriptional regulator